MRRTRGRTAAAVAVALLVVLVTGCASAVTGEDPGDAPPPGAAFDYQLGGA